MGNGVQRKEMRKYLSDVAVFKRLPEDFMPDVVSCTEVLPILGGKVLFKQGDIGTDLFVIVDGRLDLEIDGNHITVLSSGVDVGSRSLLTEEQRAATVIASTDTLLLKVSREKLVSRNIIDKILHPALQQA